MSSPQTQVVQESPLLIRTRTEFTEIGFGDVVAVPEVTQLRRDLNNILFATVRTLPEPMAQRNAALFDIYSGRAGDFFSLFYIPVWSFLHWVMAERSGVPSDLKKAAQSAHAISLFLHLWDDHLCDGQLETDIARLHLRTIAWQRFVGSAEELCQLVGLAPQLVEDHAHEYLSAQSGTDTAVDLESYLRRFSRQIAIWTLVPHTLDHWLGRTTQESSLQRLVELFACSWRLVDDIQDIHLDLVAGDRNAVWHELDASGRELWEDCRLRSFERKELEQESWKNLSRSIRASGSLARLLSRINLMLEESFEIAKRNHWPGLAREIDQSRIGIGKG
jgi:hypothetical protein